MKIFKAYSDPGHAWVSVPRALLIELKIQGAITPYSYQSPSGRTVYLEEDQDLNTFVDAYQTKFGVKPEFKTKWTNGRSRIRSLDHYRP